MLVLTRKAREQIHIGDHVVITILRIKGQTVRIGIEAPRDVHVLRSRAAQSPAVARRSSDRRKAGISEAPHRSAGAGAKCQRTDYHPSPWVTTPRSPWETCSHDFRIRRWGSKADRPLRCSPHPPCDELLHPDSQPHQCHYLAEFYSACSRARARSISRRIGLRRILARASSARHHRTRFCEWAASVSSANTRKALTSTGCPC